MKSKIAFFFVLTLPFMSCKESSAYPNKLLSKKTTSATANSLADTLTVYKTENLIINRVSNHVYEHISYLNTTSFGKVACNGMVVTNANESLVFDTPTDDKSTAELINFISKDLKSKIVGVVPTHFHTDCIGGIQEFEEHNIPTYITAKTKSLLEMNNLEFAKPVIVFKDNLELAIGTKKIYARYFGEGHTKDNIIGFFPEDNVLFGGCLIKELGGTKGNLEDANTAQWSATVRKIKMEYPDAKIVIPGHGKYGDTNLFDYTINLFKSENTEVDE